MRLAERKELVNAVEDKIGGGAYEPPAGGQGLRETPAEGRCFPGMLTAGVLGALTHENNPQ